MRDYMIDPPEAPTYPACPVCGRDDYDELYINAFGHIYGCDSCVERISACDYWQEQYDMAKEAHEDAMFEVRFES